MEFIEHPQVTGTLLKLKAEATYRDLQIFLAMHPESGDLIPQSGGFRKIRMNLPGKGKSGSARVRSVGCECPRLRGGRQRTKKNPVSHYPRQSSARSANGAFVAGQASQGQLENESRCFRDGSECSRSYLAKVGERATQSERSCSPTDRDFRKSSQARSRDCGN
jgi:hypothetical protein